MLDSGYINGDCQVGLEMPAKGKGCGKLTVVTDSLTWTTALSDAEYPNWRQVVPDHKAMPLSVRFDEKNAKEFLRAISALKSNEGAISLRCSAEGVMAGSTSEVAAFRTDARFDGEKPIDIELSAANLSRALELSLYELKISDAFSPVLFRDERWGFMASMPLRQKKNTTNQTPIKTEDEKMNKQNVQEPQKPQPGNTTTHGFTVSKPQTETQLDPFDELLKFAEDAKTTARASYDAAAQFARKLKELQMGLKRKDREQKATKDLIEKLKAASGF